MANSPPAGMEECPKISHFVSGITFFAICTDLYDLSEPAWAKKIELDGRQQSHFLSRTDEGA